MSYFSGVNESGSIISFLFFSLPLGAALAWATDGDVKGRKRVQGAIL